MSITKQRFLYNNLATAVNMTPATQGAGNVASAKKTGTGTAALTTSGAFTGSADVLVTVQCDTAGTVGSGATFQWKTSETTPGSWEATLVSATSTLTALGSDGLYIKFASGGTLVLGDMWQFWAYATYGTGNLVISDRDRYYKSGALTTTPTIVIDLGSAQTVTALVIADHNLTSSATAKLEANTSNAWTTPAYSLTLTETDQPIVAYLSQEYQYWRLYLADASNPDGFVSVGKVYLGTYSEVATGQLWGATKWGSKRTRERTRIRSVSEYGKSRRRVFSENEAFTLSWSHLTDADVTTLRTVWDSTFDADTGVDKSIFVHYWTDEPSTCFFCECLSDDFDVTYQRGRRELSLAWREEVITRII